VAEPLAAGEPVVEVRDLAKVFPVRRGVVLRRTVGHVQAVDGVALTLRRGRTVGLVGESGSGKSTLARMLVGVERPTRGQVLVEGVDVTTMSRRARRALRRRVQIVFQDPYTSLNPRMSVGEIVGEPYRIHPDAVPKGGRDRAVKELLELVGLDPRHVHRYPHQFSGGQRQRIGIARALAVKPQVLVCDEPVSALDVSVQGQVINLLEELQDELGLSYLFIAHDLAVVRHIADEVAVMYLGRIVEHGTASEVYEHAAHPYTRALMSAVPVPDPSAGLASAEIVLEGDIPSPADPPTGCHFHTRCWLAAKLAAGGEPAADGVPLRCSTESPALTDSAIGGHAVACHYAERTAVTAARIPA
jgi:oligopeptide transport system ATP-binding protein